jgi:hypothetical protein
MPVLGTGKHIHTKGYVRFSAGPHRDRLEHRVVVEQLDQEGPCRLRLDVYEVHHLDFNRAHNCPGNLLVCPPCINESMAADTTNARERIRFKHQRRGMFE